MLYKINPDEVVVAKDRHRQHFDAGASVTMAASLRKLGQIEPGVCRKVGDEIHLVVGERRLRGCKDAGIDFTYCLLEEIDDPLILEEIELEENVQRKNLTWQEEVKAKERLHRIKQERKGVPQPGKRGGHTLEDTANELGETKGLISQDIELAYFVQYSPEVAAAKNKTDAKKIVKRIKETAVRSRLLNESLTKKEETPTGETKVTLSLEDGKKLLAERLQQLVKRSLHGKMEDRIKEFEDEYFDVVIFDPPWGVDYDEVSDDNPSQEAYEDKKDVVLDKLKGWLELIYAKLKPNSHLYLFFGIVNHEVIYKTLEAVGFTTNRMPIFWYKEGAHRTRNPEHWPGRCYEAIAYARKGTKPLARFGAPDIVPTKVPTSVMKKNHRSVKHPAIYVDLLIRSCRPCDRVLDPMSGSGMFGVACEQLALTHNLEWYMIEEKKAFVDLGLFNMVEGYERITKETKEEEETPAPSKEYDEWADSLKKDRDEKAKDGFRSLIPGTENWKAWWKAHPEDQGDMLAFARAIKEGKV